MTALKVRGNRRLYGSVQLPGGKNAVLPLMAAAVLIPGKTVLHNVPELTDVEAMASVLEILGVTTQRENDIMVIDATECNGKAIPAALMQKLRASNLIWGPLLDRCGKACLPMAGGCAIGERPIDLHIRGLKALGVTVKERNGSLESSGEIRQGTAIYLDFPSVGATENLIMAAVRGRGTTTIYQAAKEPEVALLCRFLNQCGADIRGIGSDTLIIEGVKQLFPTEFTVIADRIVGGTVLLGAVMTGGKVEVKGLPSGENAAVLQKLKDLGATVTETKTGVTVAGSGKIQPCDLRTSPYPGFPTDLQPQFSAVLTKAQGTSVLTENIFENRFTQVSELKRMGGNLVIKGNTLVIRGIKELQGAEVTAHDLRCGAALVLAALGAHGETTVNGVNYIDRGYWRLESVFTSLGAEIIRTEIERTK